MSSIRLSEKHGVNPSICKCFFCGESKGIALMGKLKGDVEAPRECVLDYEPCDACQKNMALGVTLIGVVETQPSDGRPPMTAQNDQKVYPTGSWCIMKPEAVKRILNMDMTFGQKMFIEQSLLERLTSPIPAESN